MTEVISLTDLSPVTCHAWNADRTGLALSAGNSDVQIFQKRSGNFTLVQSLTEHVERVTCIDWAPKTNRIVTCSSDRNAYVWTLQGNDWKPTMVLLRINRAATCVKWSLSEKKIAVATGAKLVAVCFFDQDNDWWVSKHIKKSIRSTVLSVDWHPAGSLLAVGGCDRKTRIFSAHVNEVDGKQLKSSWLQNLEKPPSFGNAVGEFPASGWVHCVAFSGNGDLLAYVAHDASITVVDSQAGNAFFTVKTGQLPFTACLWLGASSILIAGHGCLPLVYRYVPGQSVVFVEKLDQETKEEEEQKFSAIRMFKDRDVRGADQSDATLSTIHQNTISQLKTFRQGSHRLELVSSSGIDGLIVLWDLVKLENSISKLTIE